MALLQQHGVTALADVRSSPYSRYVSQFNKAPLKVALQAASIQYVFLGQELGARPSNPDCYVDGKAVYERIAATDNFAVGLQRLSTGMDTHTIALMCAEKDPITCHRAMLVCQHLRHWDVDIQHILSNGELESHHHLEDRLLAIQGLTTPDPSPHTQLSLFGDLSPPSGTLLSATEALQEAYRRQGDRIAYVEQTDRDHEPTH